MRDVLLFDYRLTICLVAMLSGIGWSIAIRSNDVGWQRVGSRVLRAGGLAAAMRMAQLVDLGYTRQWPAGVRWLWVSSMIMLLIFGFTSAVEIVYHRPDRYWRKYVEAQHVLLASFLLVWGLGLLGQHWFGVHPMRVCFVALGLYVAAQGWYRSEWFWEHPKTQVMRGIVGDRAWSYALLAFGLVMAVVAALAA